MALLRLQAPHIGRALKRCRQTRATTGPRNDPGHRNACPSRFFFIIFVDAIFTTLFERPFTKVFDVTAQSPTISCLYRACNAD
jgi:hypothetical protein